MSGKELIGLLKSDGWIEKGRVTRGIFLYKQFPGERYPRTTTVPDKTGDLPDGTLGAILGVKQTGLGKNGLNDLIE